jgi:hypothetical protein
MLKNIGGRIILPEELASLTQKISNLTPKLLDLDFDFFAPESRNSIMSWVYVLNANHNFNWDIYPRHATSLYYAASFGLAKTVESSITTGIDLNTPNGRFGVTAPHGPVLREHIPVVRLFLEAGADPSRADFIPEMLLAGLGKRHTTGPRRQGRTSPNVCY